MLEFAKDAISWSGRKLSSLFCNTPHENALERLDTIARRARAMGQKPEKFPEYIKAEQQITQYERAKGPRYGH